MDAALPVPTGSEGYIVRADSIVRVAADDTVASDDVVGVAGVPILGEASRR